METLAKEIDKMIANETNNPNDLSKILMLVIGGRFGQIAAKENDLENIINITCYNTQKSIECFYDIYKKGRN